MDIKKLTTNINESQAAKQSRYSAGIPGSVNARNNTSDKVSLGDYQFKKDEVLFARSEYNKLAQSAFEKLKAVKAELNEYEQAKAESDEKAMQTGLGQKLNNPDVWDQIARKILES